MPDCCAFGCTNGHKGFRMYRFPSDPNKQKIWENKLSCLGWKPTSSFSLGSELGAVVAESGCLVLDSDFLLDFGDSDVMGLDRDAGMNVFSVSMEDEIPAPAESTFPAFLSCKGCGHPLGNTHLGMDLGAELCLSCEDLQSKQQPASNDSSLLGGLNKTINSDSSSKSRDVNTPGEGGKVAEKTYSCSLCSFASRYSNHLKRHMRVHDGEKPYRCYICPYASAQLVNLQRHARTHTGEKPYRCQQCAYACSSLGNLRRHQRLHSLAKPPPQQKKEKRRARRKTTDGETEEVVTLQVSRDSGFLRTLGALGSPSALLPVLLFPLCCRLCGLTLEDADLDVDKADGQGDSDGGQVCRRCSLELLTKDKAPPPYSPVTSQGSRTGQPGARICYCPRCPFLSHHPAHLTRPAHVHSEEKPHHCPHCSYTSSHLDNLKRHLRVHTGEKPYRCPVCTYACGNLANLRRHERVHSGAKPFLCSVCGYSCNQSMNLKRHMLRHTGEKPYACAECGYTTGHWDNYKRHQRKHGHNTDSWDRRAHAAGLRWAEEEPQDRQRADAT